MKTFEEDKALRQILRSVKPESPGADFSTRVMKQVFEEKEVLERVKPEPVLGRGFWIIIALFAVLIGVIAGVSMIHPDPGSIPVLLPEVDTEAVLTGYRSFFDKLGALPAGIAAIFIASSLLVFLEKWLDSRRQLIRQEMSGEGKNK